MKRSVLSLLAATSLTLMGPAMATKALADNDGGFYQPIMHLGFHSGPLDTVPVTLINPQATAGAVFGPCVPICGMCGAEGFEIAKNQDRLEINDESPAEDAKYESAFLVHGDGVTVAVMGHKIEPTVAQAEVSE